MKSSTARNKLQARHIESWLQNQIAVRGTTNVANAMGLTKSSISKWKGTWIPKIALLLAILDWGVVDDDISRLASEVAAVLTKKKRPEATGRSDQITMKF